VHGFSYGIGGPYCGVALAFFAGGMGVGEDGPWRFLVLAIVNGCMASSCQQSRVGLSDQPGSYPGGTAAIFSYSGLSHNFNEDDRGRSGESAAGGKGSSFLACWAGFPYKQVCARRSGRSDVDKLS
jgi:hypothetical protein